MANRIATILGLGFLLVGVLGFVMPSLLGAHLSLAHNIVHLVSGALSLYIGLKGSPASARMFCITFGIVYGLLGVVGFIAGSPASPTAEVPGPTDDRLLKVLPGALELGTMDHIIHILLGAIYLIGGLLTRPMVTRTAD